MTIVVSTDPAMLDVDLVAAFLHHHADWARGIPREVVVKAIAHSLCFGMYEGRSQIGFARVITDRATSAHLCDVFVIPDRRGQGFAKLLIAAVVSHPDLQNLRRFSLVTGSARSLYEKFGWRALQNPDRHLEQFDPTVYTRTT